MRYAPLALVFVLLGIAAPAHADHAWANYHWARTTNPFALRVVDSLSASWDSYLDTTITDWSASSVLDLVKEQGASGSIDRKRCNPITGKIRACNYTYGKVGWLGIASVWASGDHITAATTKMNDSYFGTAAYNTSAWKNLVMCQEIGHGFGLDHQDETFTNANLDTCMDYTNSPGSNQHPNAHDYEMLETIYTHQDTTTTIAASTAAIARQDEPVTDDPTTWGREVRQERGGRVSVFEKDLADGSKVVTHVFWIEGARGASPDHHRE